MTGDENAILRELSTAIQNQSMALQNHTVETVQRLASIETKQQAAAESTAFLNERVEKIDDKLDGFQERLGAGAERFSAQDRRIVKLEEDTTRNLQVSQSRMWDIIKGAAPFILAVGAIAWAAIK